MVLEIWCCRYTQNTMADEQRGDVLAFCWFCKFKTWFRFKYQTLQEKCCTWFHNKMAFNLKESFIQWGRIMKALWLHLYMKLVGAESTYSYSEFQLQRPVFPSFILHDVISQVGNLYPNKHCAPLCCLLCCHGNSSWCCETKQEGRRCWTPHTDYWAELAEWSHVSCLISRPRSAMTLLQSEAAERGKDAQRLSSYTHNPEYLN